MAKFCDDCGKEIIGESYLVRGEFSQDYYTKCKKCAPLYVKINDIELANQKKREKVFQRKVKLKVVDSHKLLSEY